MRGSTFTGFGRLALVACAAFASQSATAQDGGDDLATYCANTAGQYCLNTYGADSQECQDQYILNCMTGAGPRGTTHGPGLPIPPGSCIGGNRPCG